MIEQVQFNKNPIYLTDKYWDCECEDNYIHLKARLWCTKCGFTKDDMPDSMVSEVLTMLPNITESEL